MADKAEQGTCNTTEDRQANGRQRGALCSNQHGGVTKKEATGNRSGSMFRGPHKESMNHSRLHRQQGEDKPKVAMAEALFCSSCSSRKTTTGVVPHKVVWGQTTRTRHCTRGCKVYWDHLASVERTAKQITGYRFSKQGFKVTPGVTKELCGVCDKVVSHNSSGVVRV